MKKTYKIITIGCKVNAYESEAVGLLLEQEGYIRQAEELVADVCIINTCSVTSKSDAKSRQKIRHLIKYNEGCIMVVMGCYSQLKYQQASEIKGVNIVIGTDKRLNIIDYINEFKKNKKQIIINEDSNNYKKFEHLNVFKFLDNTRAYVKIQDGCNNFCSYCIIPYTRGRARSRNKEDIINEIKMVVKNGYKEIILTGIDTGGYGRDLDNYHFIDLLKDIVNEVENLPRIRISSIELNEVSDEIITLLKDNDIFVNHLHIPIQSGSEDVLKRMNRKYNKLDFIKKIEKIRKISENICLTSDVIVGFPGESEAEFEETIQTIKKVNFARLHVFPYSNRQGTVASKMKNQIDPKIKKIRVHELIELSNQLHFEYAKKFINKEVKVLFESLDEDNILIKGHSDNYLLVTAPGKANDLGKIKKVLIKKISEKGMNLTLMGEIINETI